VGVVLFLVTEAVVHRIHRRGRVRALLHPDTHLALFRFHGDVALLHSLIAGALQVRGNDRFPTGDVPVTSMMSLLKLLQTPLTAIKWKMWNYTGKKCGDFWPVCSTKTKVKFVEFKI